jgi:hypothetical protein
METAATPRKATALAPRSTVRGAGVTGDGEAAQICLLLLWTSATRPDPTEDPALDPTSHRVCARPTVAPSTTTRSSTNPAAVCRHAALSPTELPEGTSFGRAYGSIFELPVGAKQQQHTQGRPQLQDRGKVEDKSGRAVSVMADHSVTAGVAQDFGSRLCVAATGRTEDRYPQAVRKPVEELQRISVSRETRPRLPTCPPLYPQPPQALYVAFHVEREALWISSVDNFRPHTVTCRPP